jgi:hypothetical protein
MAAHSEARHERGHDDRDRIQADARLQREDALPRHLVDQRRRATEEEAQADQEQPTSAMGAVVQAGVARRRGHEPPILPCAPAP